MSAWIKDKKGTLTSYETKSKIIKETWGYWNYL